MTNLFETGGCKLVKAEFHQQAEVPPETEWFASIGNENSLKN